MSTNAIKELEELVMNYVDRLTPKMLSDIVWCALHEEEIQKMMGLVPSTLEEHYNMEHLFIEEGQTSLFIALRYSDKYGKTEEEQIEEAKNINQYVTRTSKRERPYDYDLTFKFEQESFVEWCDDYDRAALMRNNQDAELYRLSFLALAIGFNELAVYIFAFINPSALEDIEFDETAREKTEAAWIQEFIDKQPEGVKQNELIERIEKNWPLIKEDRAKHFE